MYIIIGMFFIYLGSSALIRKKYPMMNNYYKSLKEKCENINRHSMILLDGISFSLIGFFLILGNVIFNYGNSSCMILVIVMLLFILLLYFILRKKILLDSI